MPRFIHDCEACTSLGHYEFKEQGYDLYFCTQDRKWPTVIARYGDAGDEYISGLEIANVLARDPKDLGHPLVVARQRAIERQLISKEEAMKR